MKAELTDPLLWLESLVWVLMGLADLRPCCSTGDFATGVITIATASMMSSVIAAVIVLLFFVTGVVTSSTASTMLSVIAGSPFLSFFWRLGEENSALAVVLVFVLPETFFSVYPSFLIVGILPLPVGNLCLLFEETVRTI